MVFYRSAPTDPSWSIGSWLMLCPAPSASRGETERPDPRWSQTNTFGGVMQGAARTPPSPRRGTPVQWSAATYRTGDTPRDGGAARGCKRSGALACRAVPARPVERRASVAPCRLRRYGSGTAACYISLDSAEPDVVKGVARGRRGDDPVAASKTLHLKIWAVEGHLGPLRTP